jgi:hypothetical protein
MPSLSVLVLRQVTISTVSWFCVLDFSFWAIQVCDHYQRGLYFFFPIGRISVLEFIVWFGYNIIIA